MRHLTYFLLIILTASCGQNTKTSKVDAETSTPKTNLGETFSLISIQQEDYDKTSAITSIAIDTTSIQKRKGKFTLPIEDSALLYQNKHNPNNEEEDVTYTYLGYYQPIEKYLLLTTYYEGADYELISKNGSKTKIWSEPIFSNDHKYFLCFMPYGLEGEPVGIQIWKIKEDEGNTVDPIQLVKIFELDQLMFNPIECKWSKDGSILIKAEKMKDNFYPEDPVVLQYYKLRYQ